MSEQWEKQVTAGSLPMSASDQDKVQWIEQQHQLAKTWFSYKFKPRNQEVRSNYVDNVLADLQETYLYFFRWEENIQVIEDLYYGTEIHDTGPGVEIIMLGGPWKNIFALNKETVLGWARQEGVVQKPRA